MGLIKVACTEKGVSLEVSLKHNFPTNGDTQRKSFSTDFNCPYAFQGGLVRCCYPNKITSNSRKPAWLIPIEGEYLKNLTTTSCPVHLFLIQEVCPLVYLGEKETAMMERSNGASYLIRGDGRKTEIKSRELC